MKTQTLAAKTSWGDLLLTVRDHTILTCTLPAKKNGHFSYLGLSESHPLSSAIDLFLSELFAGKPAHFGGKVNPQGTFFQQKVWQQLNTIPRGETRSYGQIATQINNPKAVRAVGGACGANPLPLFIPCHRVTAKNGLGGFAAGPEWKRILLGLEHNGSSR